MEEIIFICYAYNPVYKRLIFGYFLLLSRFKTLVKFTQNWHQIIFCKVSNHSPSFLRQGYKNCKKWILYLYLLKNKFLHSLIYHTHISTKFLFNACCVFPPANRCSACCLLVEIIFLMLKQVLPSFSIANRKNKSAKKLQSTSI